MTSRPETVRDMARHLIRTTQQINELKTQADQMRTALTDKMIHASIDHYDAGDATITIAAGTRKPDQQKLASEQPDAYAAATVLQVRMDRLRAYANIHHDDPDAWLNEYAPHGPPRLVLKLGKTPGQGPAGTFLST